MRFVIAVMNSAAALPPEPFPMKSLHSIPMKSLRNGALLILALGIFASASARADLNSDLAFTAFHDVDVNVMASGTVLQARGGLMAFQRGITSQSLFIIDAAPADVAHKLVTWNPSAHPDLKVWLHKALPPAPTVADFAELANLPENSSTKFQLDSTANLDPAKPVLQVSKEEAQLIASTAAQEKDPKALFAKVWPQILVGRINNFLAGKGTTDDDMVDGGDVHPLSDVKSLLHGDIKIYGAYQKLLSQTPLKSLAGAGSAKLAPVNLYCDIFDVEGYAAMGTGAVFQAPNGPAIQSVDVEYYTNSGVYATIELEQMWPIAVNGKNETLVWRDDLVSAPNIAVLHGVDRMGASMIMLQETKGGIQAFRDEFK
jgi:hypothetical protein